MKIELEDKKKEKAKSKQKMLRRTKDLFKTGRKLSSNLPDGSKDPPVDKVVKLDKQQQSMQLLTKQIAAINGNDNYHKLKR